MITFTRPAPNIIVVTGMDVSETSPAVWRLAMERMASYIQTAIRARYQLEYTAFKRRFRANSPQWTSRKARQGWALDRGQMLRRIVRRLYSARLFSISAVTPQGTAVITFDEMYLYQLEPHARFYARNKVPGGRILTVNDLDVQRYGSFLHEADAAGRQRASKRRERKAANFKIGPDTVSQRLDRRAITLADTAWRAVAATTARLRSL